MRKQTLGVTAAALLALILVGCGSPASTQGVSKGDAKTLQVYAKFNKLSGQPRTKALVAAAKKEHSLSIYTSNTDMDDIVDAFSDKYGIDVSVYRGNSESVLQRALQEAKAGFRGADLIETNALELNVLNEEGQFAPYKGELRAKVRKEGQADGWTADRFNVFVVGWNNNKVDPGQEPKTLEELASPKWKGKVSMEVGDVDWFTAMYDYYRKHGKSEQQTVDLFKKLAANSKVVKGHTVQGELLSAGQFSVATSIYSHTVDKAARDGAPVAWRPEGGEPVQPVVIRPNGAGLMKSAKHPAAALLFMDFVLTEGQGIVANSFRIGSVPTADDPLAGLEVATVPEDQMLKNPKKWDELYQDVIEGGDLTK